MDLVAPGFGGLIAWQFIGIAFIGLWIYAIINLVNSEFNDPNMKLIWVLIIIFTPFGPLIYFAFSKKGKKRDFSPDFSKISNPESQ